MPETKLTKRDMVIFDQHKYSPIEIESLDYNVIYIAYNLRLVPEILLKRATDIIHMKHINEYTII
jgi:hypothetical protein